MQKRRTYPPKAALPFLAGLAIIGVASIAIRNPKPVGMFLRFMGAGAAGGYVAIEHQRRKIESGQEELDIIALAEARLKVREQQLEERQSAIEQDILDGIRLFDEERDETLAAIEREWQAIESQKQELVKMGAELSARRATLDFEQETWEKDATLRVKKLELSLHDLRHEIEVREHNIAVREAEFKTMTRTLALQEQAKLEQAKDEMLSDHQSRMAEIQHERDKVIVDREILEEQYLQLSGELEAAKQELAYEHEIREQKIQEQIELKQVEMEMARQQLLIDFEEGVAAHIAKSQEFVDNLQSTIALLTAEIQGRDALKIFSPEDKYAGVVGNWILEVIRANRIEVHPHMARNLPWGTHNQPAIVVWLRLGNESRLEDIARIKTTIEGRVNIHPLAMGMDANGFVVFAIGDVRGAVEMPAKPAEESAKDGSKLKQLSEARITEPSPQLVEQVIGRGFFYLVAGPPRAGKSAWVNNLMTYRAAYLGKQVEFVINNLKYPDRGTPIVVRGEKLTPKYVLLEPVSGLEKFGLCVDGLTDMYASALARKNQLLFDEVNGRPLSRFTKRMWIIDEAPALSDACRTVAKTCISNTIRIGGALDEAVLLIGQSYNPDDYGVRRPILHNVTQFYLGASYAQEAIRKKQIAVSAGRAKELMSEVHARQALAAKQIEQGILVNGQPPARYFALVAGEGEAFLMTLPPPGAFDDMPVMEEDDETPIVLDEDLAAAVKSTIYEEIEKAKAEEGLTEGAVLATKSKTAPGFNTAEMSPLQRSIVEFCQARVGQMFTPSAIHSGSREVQKAIDEAQRNLKPAQRKQPSALVKDACEALVSEWGVGAIDRGLKGSVKFGIQR